MEIVKNIELISSLCPGNPDVEFTYICALYAALQGREATKELQLFMKKYPEYLEAKRMNEHYEDWPHPPGIFHLPSWSDQETKIPEIVKNRQGSSGWHSVRDGIFRIVSAFIPCSKSDLRDTPTLKTRCKINAEFTHTPYGPVVGLYTLLEDDPSTPFYHEQLMNPVYDTLFKPTGFVYRIF